MRHPRTATGTLVCVHGVRGAAPLSYRPPPLGARGHPREVVSGWEVSTESWPTETVPPPNILCGLSVRSSRTHSPPLPPAVVSAVLSGLCATNHFPGIAEVDLPATGTRDQPWMGSCQGCLEKEEGTPPSPPLPLGFFFREGGPCFLRDSYRDPRNPIGSHSPLCSLPLGFCQTGEGPIRTAHLLPLPPPHALHSALNAHTHTHTLPRAAASTEPRNHRGRGREFPAPVFPVFADNEEPRCDSSQRIKVLSVSLQKLCGSHFLSRHTITFKLAQF